jgi:hypothetical protein
MLWIEGFAGEPKLARVNFIDLIGLPLKLDKDSVGHPSEDRRTLVSESSQWRGGNMVGAAG